MVEVIRDKKIVVEPNLTNYDEIYRNFNWDNARKTLNFVGKGNVSKLASVNSLGYLYRNAP